MSGDYVKIHDSLESILDRLRKFQIEEHLAKFENTEHFHSLERQFKDFQYDVDHATHRAKESIETPIYVRVIGHWQIQPAECHAGEKSGCGDIAVAGEAVAAVLVRTEIAEGERGSVTLPVCEVVGDARRGEEAIEREAISPSPESSPKRKTNKRLQIRSDLPVEWELRPIAVDRKNHLFLGFLGSDRGGRSAAIIHSPIRTCKRHSMQTFGCLRNVLNRIADHPVNRIEELTLLA